MSRVRSFATKILPAMLAGGLVFGAAFGHAAVGDGPQPDPRPHPHAAPVPPLPPAPPAPPAPPVRVHGRPGGVSVKVHNGQIQIRGLDNFAGPQLEAIRQLILHNPNIPRDVRDKLLARLDATRGILQRRLRNLSVSDFDKLGDEMEKMGDEIEKVMEGLEGDLGKLGDKIGKDLAKQLGKDFARDFAKDLAKSFQPGQFQITDGDDHDPDTSNKDGGDDDDAADQDDDADDHSVAVTADANLDSDASDAIRDLSGMSLKPDQRQQIVKLRSESESKITVARKQLDDASRRLEVALADPNASEVDIARYVDDVSMYEAAIRKARLLTWVKARRVLDESQRKKIESAARKNHR